LTSVQLSVYAGNVAAERFYEKLGFAPLRHILIQPLTDN
jgi:ribosomal protein S18 acetylase RimI-like enzyme